jgi:hypothetical protein
LFGGVCGGREVLSVVATRGRPLEDANLAAVGRLNGGGSAGTGLLEVCAARGWEDAGELCLLELTGAWD